MRMARLLLVMFLTWPSAAVAQARITGPAPSILSVTPTKPSQLAQLAEADSVSEPTHWKEGALVGALAGAVAGGVLGQAICEQGETSSCSTVPGILLGAALLAIPGALIGGQFPKEPREEEVGSSGYSHFRIR
jgi:hypothetical protein